MGVRVNHDDPTVRALASSINSEFGTDPSHMLIAQLIVDQFEVYSLADSQQRSDAEAILATHELIGKSAPAGEHECRLITKPHDGCGCTRIVIGCTGCDWIREADGTQGDAHRAHVAALLDQRIAAAKAEGAALGRRATNDPGAFVKRGPDYEGNEYGERLDQWQTRAIEAAITQGVNA